MPLIFISPSQIQGSTLVLDDPSELHHLRHVLRVKVGDRVVCSDGQGREYAGYIRNHKAKALLIEIERSVPTQDAMLKVWLAVALLKSDRFDWMVQKATELGVSRISPLITRHTVVKVNLEQARHKQKRWHRIAQEAAKQCERSTIPIIDLPHPLEAVLTLMKDLPLILIPTLRDNAEPLKAVLQRNPPFKEIAIFIGPEGDFSSEEITQARSLGAYPVSLGSLTLRAETAALAVLAILRYVSTTHNHLSVSP